MAKQDLFKGETMGIVVCRREAVTIDVSLMGLGVIWQCTVVYSLWGSPIRSQTLSLTKALLLEQWFLYHEVVRIIWVCFGQAEVDPFAKEESTHYPLCYSLKRASGALGQNALAHPSCAFFILSH